MNELKRDAIRSFETGRYREAQKYCKVFLKKAPRDFDVRFLLGLVQFKDQAFKDARATFRAALQLNPNSVSAMINLAVCEYELEQFQHAREILENALRLDPKAKSAYQELAKCFLKLGEFQRALTSAEEGLRIQPKDPSLQLLKGHICFRCNNWAQAAVQFGAVHEEYPLNKEALEYLLISLALSEQADRIREVVAQEVNFAKLDQRINALGSLVDFAESILRARRYFEALMLFNALRDAVAHIQLKNGLSSQCAILTDRVLLGVVQSNHALYRTREAKAVIQQARSGSQQQRIFDLCELSMLIENGERGQAESLCRSLLDRGEARASLYFSFFEVVGARQAKSHIGAIEALLEDDCTAVDDKVTLHFVLSKAFRELGDEALSFSHLHRGNVLKKATLRDLDRRSKGRFRRMREISGALRSLQRKDDAQLVQRPIFIVGMPRSGTSLIEQILTRSPAAFGLGELPYLDQVVQSGIESTHRDPTKEEIENLRASYLGYVSRFNTEAPVLIDKTTTNFFFVGLLSAAIPEAKFIHIYRDPRAVCWSNYCAAFRSANMPFAYDYSDMVEFYGGYAKLMNFWEQLNPGRIFHQCYEQLTQNPLAETRKIFDYAELPWSADVVDVRANLRPVRTLSQLQVREAIYSGSSDAWREYEARLAPLLNRLRASGLLNQNGVFGADYSD